MKIVSWNVNGIRACARKGFLDWLDSCEADIVGLQEVRALPEQLTADVLEPAGWYTHFSPAERKGYSGVALYSRTPFDSVRTELGVPEFDAEGRVQIAEVGDIALANVYFPNGSGKNRDNSRIPFKLDFYKRLYDVLDEMRGSTTQVVIGDFNTAHRPIDLARPKSNTKTSGFRPEEREELDRWLREGWVDTFRHIHGDSEGHYTWWSNRPGIRERNVGWRIDYGLMRQDDIHRCSDAFILPDVMGSDHCPLGLSLDLS